MAAGLGYEGDFVCCCPADLELCVSIWRRGEGRGFGGDVFTVSEISFSHAMLMTADACGALKCDHRSVSLSYSGSLFRKIDASLERHA